MAQSDDEDDYMKMVFVDAPRQAGRETDLQRARRERKEAETRAYSKTKAELKEEEEVARQEALSTALPASNKGFKMMAKFGFKHGDVLGQSEGGRKEPIHVNIKDDKGGIGMDSEKKRKFREKWEKADRDQKRSKVDEADFRTQRQQQFKEQQHTKDLAKAQKTALHYDEKDDNELNPLSTPLKSINVLWRRLVRHRFEKERDLKQAKLLNSLRSGNLPVHLGDDEENDDKTALGRETVSTLVEDDLDDEDPELDEFEALPVEDRLRKIVVFLRETHHYCYWCGHEYSDDTMDGCPGVTEEEHD